MKLVKLLFVCMLLFGIVWLYLNRKPEVWKKVTGWIEMRKERTIYVFMFLFIVLSQIWMPFLRLLPISSDETYTIAGAAFFAGYNWSSFMHLKKFYNFGYSMLLAPIFKLFDEPVTIFRAMLVCNVFVHAVIMLIIYHILRSQFKCTKCFSIAASMVCGCNALVLFFRGFMYSELSLTLVVWIITLLLLKLPESTGRTRIVLSAGLGGVAAYAYIIHSRCVIIYAALGLLILLYLVAYKKWLIQPVSFTAVFASLIYLEHLLVEYVQKNLYLQGTGIVMPNSVEHVVTGTWRYKPLLSLSGIKKLICHFFSLAGTVSIKTGGVFTIVTAAILYYLIKNISRYRRGEENKSMFVILLFSSISLWGMVAAIALTGAANGRFRFVAYSRYFVPFFGPFLLCGLVILKRYIHIHFKWIAILSVVLTIVVCGIYLFYTYPILKGNSLNEIPVFYFFRVFARSTSSGVFGRSIFLISLFLLVAFTGGYLFLYKKKQMIAICVAATIFSVCLFWRVEEVKCIPTSVKRGTLVDASYQVIKSRDAYGIENVYCLGANNFRKTMLFKCYDEDIIYDMRDIQLADRDIAVSDKKKAIMNYNPKYIYQMDDNEWIGLWDDELNKIFQEKYNSVQ